MKKLNNKGITIVELIISFTLLMIIAMGMLNVVNEIRSFANQKLEEKKVTEFKNDLYKDFHKTMLTKEYKSMTDCSTSSSICKEIIFKDNTKTIFKIDLLAKEIEFNDYKYVLPYNMEVNFLNNYDNECNNSCVSIIEEDNYLIIDVPYFKTVILDEMLNDDTFKEEFYNNISKYNLGFKIIYPYNL